MELFFIEQNEPSGILNEPEQPSFLTTDLSSADIQRPTVLVRCGRLGYRV